MADFTPGPWSVPHFAQPEIACQCGYVLVEGFFGAVATVHFSADRKLENGDNPPPEQAIANANLIAAAPEMYEALKAAEKLLSKFERAICGNDKLNGCEEFYRGYNAVTRRVAVESGQALTMISAAIAKSDGKAVS